MLINNHEVSGCEPFRSRSSRASSTTSRRAAARRTIEVDRHGNRIRQYVSLAGTPQQLRRRAHAVGHLADLRGDRGRPAAKPHGYVFEVDPYDQRANRDPKPIKALGRYAHEALRRRPATTGAST